MLFLSPVTIAGEFAAQLLHKRYIVSNEPWTEFVFFFVFDDSFVFLYGIGSEFDISTFVLVPNGLAFLLSQEQQISVLHHLIKSEHAVEESVGPNIDYDQYHDNIDHSLS